MKNKFLSLILLLCMVVGVMTGCFGNKPEFIDYAAQVTLDMNSETLKQEVTVKNYIDGDTTHFNVPTSIESSGVLKARYIACNTPESTGKIEEWGKKASNFTKEHLKSATSIIIEADGTTWEKDSTGERYLVWVWYKSPETGGVYRNLNIEILQNGLAIGSKAGENRYGTVCNNALHNASLLELHIHSSEADPDFYYGAAQNLTLKELRLNTEEYEGVRVSFNCTVTQYYNNGVYVEDYDEETQRYYGMYLYYGFTLSSLGQKKLVPGNRMFIVGKVNPPSEAFPNYQVSDLMYDVWMPDDPNNIKLLEENQPISYKLTTVDDFLSQVTLQLETEDGITNNDYAYGALAMDTSISMQNLYVNDAYTTNNEDSKSNGAITLYCKMGDKEVAIRTSQKLKKPDGSDLVEADLLGKTIDVKGIVDYYNGTYQIKVFAYNDITIH
ncbi:MAG: thermonuclease family protein [Clostridia bacterium]|nr:thermonuclease family protein [Clostridia bacterium]